ncbi:hypothetical protein HK101_008959, partial [Irineochytrium annulatum]
EWEAEHARARGRVAEGECEAALGWGAGKKVTEAAVGKEVIAESIKGKDADDVVAEEDELDLEDEKEESGSDDAEDRQLMTGNHAADIVQQRLAEKLEGLMGSKPESGLEQGTDEVEKGKEGSDSSKVDYGKEGVDDDRSDDDS